MKCTSNNYSPFSARKTKESGLFLSANQAIIHQADHFNYSLNVSKSHFQSKKQQNNFPNNPDRQMLPDITLYNVSTQRRFCCCCETAFNFIFITSAHSLYVTYICSHGTSNMITRGACTPGGIFAVAGGIWKDCGVNSDLIQIIYS